MEKEKSNKKTKVILVIVIILLLAVIGFLVWYILHPKEEEKPVETAPSVNALGYDSTYVAIDEDSLLDALKKMKAQEGTMALSMKATAHSADGLNFTCDLSNSPKNSYDMFMVLYLDSTGEELYRSGLIPTGKMINEFKSNRKLDPGTYSGTLVYNQVEDDKATVHASVTVGLTLVVR